MRRYSVPMEVSSSGILQVLRKLQSIRDGGGMSKFWRWWLWYVVLLNTCISLSIIIEYFRGELPNRYPVDWVRIGTVGEVAILAASLLFAGLRAFQAWRLNRRT